MPVLPFELLATTHDDHKPTMEGNYLVLCAAEPPVFVKRGTSKHVRTGIKLQVPRGHVCAVAYRVKHGNGHVLANLSLYTASPKLDAEGKPVEGSEGEGLTGEISVQVTAPNNGDLNIRFGEQFAVAFLLQSIKLEAPKKEASKKEALKQE